MTVTDALNIDVLGQLPWVELARRIEGTEGQVEMQFEMMLAVGAVDARYRVEYLNYKEAAVTYKIK